MKLLQLKKIEFVDSYLWWWRRLWRGRRRLGGGRALGQTPGGLCAVLGEKVQAALVVARAEILQHRDGGDSGQFIFENALALQPHPSRVGKRVEKAQISKRRGR